MSMTRCDKCDAYIDTDYDVECYQEDDSCLCPRCRENKWEEENRKEEETK